MSFDRVNAIKKLRQCLQKNEVTVGSWMQLPDSSVAEIMGEAGYDWIAVDLEHGSMSVDQLPDIFRALECGSTLPLVRLAKGDMKDCKQALDAGAGGVIVPMVESAEQLRAIKDACCWPPAGTRGVGFSRANLFGKNFDSYMVEAQAPLLVAMIESICAVEHLQKILAVDGLDAILIGPYDLSASMGLTAQFQHPDVKLALRSIQELSKASHIACGIHVVEPLPEELHKRIEEGYQFLAYSVDAVFLNRVISNPYRS